MSSAGIEKCFTPLDMGKASQNLLLLIFYFLRFLAYSGNSVSSITNDEDENIFFSCLASVDMNYTTPYAPAYHQIFHLAAYNLRITKSLSSMPIAIILPETKEKLATAIMCSRKSSLTFTIRSGGHSFEGSSYSAMNPIFVMIDLMNLHKVSIDLDSETAWVEGGATIGEIYHEIGRSSNHLGFSAGLCPAVGSGGHIGGGGYGLMSRKFGLAADNVVDAILVDANGRFWDRKTMEEDVFWAIRGGGAGCWGAIYSWKIQLVDVPATVTTFRITRRASMTKSAELLDKWQVVAPNLEDDFTLMVSVISESETSVMSIFQGLYLGPKSLALASLSHCYPELNLVANECNEMSWVESVAYFPGINEEFIVDDLKDRFLMSNQKFYYKWKGDYVRERISIKGIEGILNMLMVEPKGQLELSPLGGIMSRIESNAIPFPHRNGNLYSIGYLVAWGEEDHSSGDACMDWIHRPRAAYVNEMDLDLGIMDWENLDISADEFVEQGRAWGEKYFLENYDRLVRAKTLIDPGNLFRHKQSIPPKPFHDLDFGMNQSISY